MLLPNQSHAEQLLKNHLKQATRALTPHWARATACCPYTARGYPRANPLQPAGT
jgi:hypothetical protein